jgi:hypothetical protein
MQFNNQFATIKLRETIAENQVIFSIDDQKIDDLFSNEFRGDVEYVQDGSDVYYVIDQNDFEKFVDYVQSVGLDSNNIHVHEYFKEQGNVTGGGEAYLPGLDVPEKKYKGQNEGDGYEKVKGFRAGHTPDRGGFQYKDLWDVNEEYETDKKLKVTLKGNINYNKIGDVTDVSKDGKYYTLQFKNGKTAIYHQSDLTKPAAQKSFEEKPRLDISEEDIQEAYVPDNIKNFAKRKQITGIVNQVARWAEKAGKRIVGGTAVGKNYSTLILDLTYQGGEVRINTDDETIEVNGDWVDSYQGFVAALSDESLNENYHRFKKETVTRSKEQQMHEAIKLVRKKLYEAEKVMDYVNTMKEELGLREYKGHTSKLMEKLQVSISEIYKKYKSIK